MPAMIRTKVDLPAPFSPTSPCIDPALRVISALSRARTGTVGSADAARFEQGQGHGALRSGDRHLQTQLTLRQPLEERFHLPAYLRIDVLDEGGMVRVEADGSVGDTENLRFPQERSPRIALRVAS
jgi:hypothetical protein